jgi:hypothetical protein
MVRLDTPFCSEIHIISVDNNIFALVYAGSYEDKFDMIIGTIVTIRIDSGEWKVNTIDYFEFSAIFGAAPTITELQGGDDEKSFFATLYGRTEYCDGLLGSVQIDIAGDQKKVVGKDHAYELELNVGVITASINDAISVSGLLLGDEWNLVVLTYDMFDLHLYIVNNEGLQDICIEGSAAISSNSNDVIFGEFKGILDEVGIYHRILSEGDVEDEFSFRGGTFIMGGNGGDDKSGLDEGTKDLMGSDKGSPKMS